MKQLLGRIIHGLAPSSVDGLRDLRVTRETYGLLHETVRRLEDENHRLEERMVVLEQEVDEARRLAPRIAELYDLVFERLAQDRR